MMLRWKPNRKSTFLKTLGTMRKYWDTFLPGREDREDQAGVFMANANISPVWLRSSDLLGKSVVLPVVYADYEFSSLEDRERVTELYGTHDELGDYTLVNMCATDRTYYLLHLIGHLLGLDWGRIALCSAMTVSYGQTAMLGLSELGIVQRPVKLQIILAATNGHGGVPWKAMRQEMKEALKDPHLVVRVGHG